MLSPLGGPTLEESDVVSKVDSGAISSPLANTPEKGPSLACKGYDFSSLGKAVEPSCLAP